jgi:hypothetical protein
MPLSPDQVVHERRTLVSGIQAHRAVVKEARINPSSDVRRLAPVEHRLHERAKSRMSPILGVSERSSNIL